MLKKANLKINHFKNQAMRKYVYLLLILNSSCHSQTIQNSSVKELDILVNNRFSSHQETDLMGDGKRYHIACNQKFLDSIAIKYPKIEKLIIANNGLKILPELQVLSDLRELNLENNNLTSLNLNPLSVPKLKIIDLSGNNNLDIISIFQILSKFDSLEIIYLSNCKLTMLPSNIYLLKNNIKYLELGNNELTSLPQETIELKKLKIVGLEKNKFKEIPSSLINFKSQILIKIGNNPINQEYKESILERKNKNINIQW